MSSNTNHTNFYISEFQCGTRSALTDVPFGQNPGMNHIREVAHAWGCEHDERGTEGHELIERHILVHRDAPRGSYPDARRTTYEVANAHLSTLNAKTQGRGSASETEGGALTIEDNIRVYVSLFNCGSQTTMTDLPFGHSNEVEPDDVRDVGKSWGCEHDDSRDSTGHRFSHGILRSDQPYAAYVSKPMRKIGTFQAAKDETISRWGSWTEGVNIPHE